MSGVPLLSKKWRGWQGERKSACRQQQGLMRGEARVDVKVKEETNVAMGAEDDGAKA
jgi:hypothetical protein